MNEDGEIDDQRLENVVRTTVTHKAILFVCSCRILMSSMIYYWTDAWEHGIYLLIQWFSIVGKHLLIKHACMHIIQSCVNLRNPLAFQISMFFSACYHLFCCHSEKAFHLWLSLDLAGISLGLCACYVPAVYYAFYCYEVCTRFRFWLKRTSKI